jgi:hypothetical protein
MTDCNECAGTDKVFSFFFFKSSVFCFPQGPTKSTNFLAELDRIHRFVFFQRKKRKKKE